MNTMFNHNPRQAVAYAAAHTARLIAEAEARRLELLVRRSRPGALARLRSRSR